MLRSLRARWGGAAPIDLVDYWRVRARTHGRRSVLNLDHGEEAFQQVTAFQWGLLEPLLGAALDGSESQILDFGCGPGRFTPALAERIGGKAVGVDITQELLDLAPLHPAVSYRRIESGALPFSDGAFDAVWACLVLGGIPDGQIEPTLAEIRRVLRPGGLFFFVENTATVPDAAHWFFRSAEDYQRLAAFCRPAVVGGYEDRAQPITVFCGRGVD